MSRSILSPRFNFAVTICISWLLIFSVSDFARGQASDEQGYRLPPKALADIVDAPLTPLMLLSPDKKWMLISERQSWPSIAELSQPELRLAGRRINPVTNGRSRRLFSVSLTLKNVLTGENKQITGLPEGALIENVKWSPGGLRVAFTITGNSGIELWMADHTTASARVIADARLNSTFGSPFYWVSDGESLVCKVIVSGRGSAPEAQTVPAGPVIQENVGRAAPVRTYQDLLENPFDESLFEYYFTSQVAVINIDGSVRTIAEPGVVYEAAPSPDGRYVLIETYHKPYSYLVPFYRFPTRVELWDMRGNLVKTVADLPLAENIPVSFDAVRTGPRSIGWRADAPATLYWAEAQDSGDPGVEAETRDRIFLLDAPFDGEPVPLASLGMRFAGVNWGDGDLTLVYERWWKNRRTKVWRVRPDAPESGQSIIFDRSFEDRYSDPGRPVMKTTSFGTSILKTKNNGKTIFLIGQGASSEGNRPFLDEFDLDTLKSERRWRSEAPYYESPVALLDDTGDLLITSRESPSEQPNYYLRSLADSELKKLTEFPHPTPQLKDVTKELIKYEREDGVELNATLYLPAGYTPDQGPLPMLMWAYPREFKSASAAAQVSGSPYSFVRVYPTSPLVFLAHGYAVLSGPTMPIIGEGDEEPNDTFITQLVASAKAAVDEVVRRGVADPERIAIGGHSYGAFMAANLLAHSDLFVTGIARSGAYNRTLTPFGFQAEERTYWQAPEVYYAMSPFMHADKVNEPILLIHGMADNNSGTFPIQSRRYYHALKGHGVTARLVMLPNESHGYRARESLMHMLWEMAAWLDKYVKGDVDIEDL